MGDESLQRSAVAMPRSFTFRSSEDPVLRAQPWRLATALAAHADQKPRERVLLYALVFALAPRHVLEIGVRWGGGTRIIHAALSDLGRGELVSIDPDPALEYDIGELGDRATLIVGASPAELPRARELTGANFDLVFVDGDHSERGVAADLKGLLDVTSPGAVVLLHDAFHAPVARAIEAALIAGGWIDCGIVADTRNAGVRLETGQDVVYGGVRMLRRA
ncbi:MAG: class I SAM-dependent methyltransferase [Phycisphaerae bacterium]